MSVKSGTIVFDVIEAGSKNNTDAISAHIDWSTELIGGNTYSMTVKMYAFADATGVDYRSCYWNFWINDVLEYTEDQFIEFRSNSEVEIFTKTFEVTTDDNGLWANNWIGGIFYFTSQTYGRYEVSGSSDSDGLVVGRANYRIFYYTGYGSNGLFKTQTHDDGTCFDNGDTCNVIDTNPSRSNSSSSANFTITGNKNGGDVDTSVTAVKTETTRYIFKGWSKTNGSTTAEFDSSSTFTVNGNINLYAVWSSSITTTYSNNTLASLPNPTRSANGGYYNITLIPNNGTASEIIEAGSYTSYTFKGWSASSSGSILDGGTSYTSDSTVYAIWASHPVDKTPIDLPTPIKDNTIIDNYTVNLDPNEGSLNNTIYKTNKIRFYEFKGWSTVSDNSVNIVSNTYTPTNKSSHNLYAIWHEYERTEPISLPVPTYPSFKFLGWAINPNSTVYVENNYIPTQNISLFAIYKSVYTGQIYVWNNGKWHKTLSCLRFENVFNECINAT